MFAGLRERSQTERHTEGLAASEALSKLDSLSKLSAREAALVQSEESLTERQGRLSQAAGTARQELLTLRRAHQQVIR